jgi:hypothetical protein
MIKMLSWSNTKYRFTFGIGSLATTGAMAELWKPILPLWVIMVVALLPLVVFVFVHPDEMPARFVRASDVFASTWYVLSFIALSFGLCLAPTLPKGWVVFPLCCMAGLVPAIFVLHRAVRGRYRLPNEGPDGDATAG